MTIKHHFEPLLTIETDDDGSNPRLTGVDWGDTHIGSMASPGISDEAVDDAGEAASEWLDTLTGHLTAAIQAVCTEPTVYARTPYVYVNDTDGIRVSAGVDTLAIELDGEPRVGLLSDGVAGDPTLVIWSGIEGQDDSVAIHLGNIDLNGHVDDVARAVIADIGGHP